MLPMEREEDQRSRDEELTPSLFSPSPEPETEETQRLESGVRRLERRLDRPEEMESSG